MATISDQLAQDIHNAFSRYYTDLANQDQIFFGAGNVTITKQDGTTATVASWAKVQADNAAATANTNAAVTAVAGRVTTLETNAASKNAANTFTALQTFSAGLNVTVNNINCSGDNSMIYLGKNSDLALFKKQGQGGTIAVGAETPFKVQRTSTAAVTTSAAVEDIFVIGTNNQTTLPGALSAGGNIDNTSKGRLLSQAIELSMSTPYIDFHFNNSTADYTTRLIEYVAGELTLEGAFMCKKHLYAWGGVMARNIAPDAPANGLLITGAPFQSMIQGRGAYGDARGAVANYYLEERVGEEHRAVVYLDGYGRTDAWLFRPGGAITTGLGDVLTTGSDVRLKDEFTEAPANAAARVDALGVCEYRMRGEQRRRRGFLAQQAEKADELYTFLSVEQEIDGEHFSVMNVDYAAIMADLVTVVQELLAHNRELEKRVTALEAANEEPPEAESAVSKAA